MSENGCIGMNGGCCDASSAGRSCNSDKGSRSAGPNDVTIDGKGRLYFTDLTGGAVYRIDGPGQLARILAAPDIQRPNGIQISPDDKQLYLIEANGAEGGARMIRAYDLHADGTVANMRVHYKRCEQRSPGCPVSSRR
jgi:gluconolactonase